MFVGGGNIQYYNRGINFLEIVSINVCGRRKYSISQLRNKFSENCVQMFVGRRNFQSHH